MPDRWYKAFRVAAMILCFIAILPVLQMMFRKLPLDDIKPIALPKAAAEEATPSEPADGKPSGSSSRNKKSSVPPEIDKRSAKLESSGIMGRTPKPPPMALVGIAEPFAFLRSPQGQMVKIREGESMNGVKVLKVGANRVLVEHEEQTSELSIFSGIGSESLMSP